VAAISIPVRNVLLATPRTRIISLDFASKPFSFAAGQAVMLGLHDSPLRKPYSIASAPWELDTTGQLRVLAQVDNTGTPDPHLEHAAPGTLLDLEGPFGSFALPEDARHGLLLVAGGTGIAPLRSMLIDRLARPAAIRIALVYSARSPEEFAFRSELDALRLAGRIAAHFTITRDQDGPWTGRRGRIDESLLREALPSTESHCLLCGPQTLVADTTQLLKKMGVSEERILTEKY
jgi:CDP-4-dehydro-6-deoxyglucose reductase